MNLKLDLPAMKFAFARAHLKWAPKGDPVDSTLFDSYPQSSPGYTEFAALLFAELTRDIHPTGTAFYTFKSINKEEHPSIHRELYNQFPNLEVQIKEFISMDFAFTVRESSKSVREIILGMESEMNPLTKKGIDPEVLFPDFVKLCNIHAKNKIFICRITHRHEEINGNTRPIIERFANAFRSCMNEANARWNPSSNFGIFIIETGSRPRRVHLISSIDNKFEVFELPSRAGMQSLVAQHPVVLAS